MYTAKLIVGLGNPTALYGSTRHNLGQFFVQQLAEHYRIKLKYSSAVEATLGTIMLYEHSIRLATLHCYMNLSGGPIHRLLRSYRLRIEELLVLHDDLEVPIGQVQWKFGGGHAGHNGLRHIIQRNGSASFTRLRIGIGRPKSNQPIADFVLSQPSRSEMKLLQGVKLNIFNTINVYYAEGFAAAQAELQNQNA